MANGDKPTKHDQKPPRVTFLLEVSFDEQGCTLQIFDVVRRD